MMKLCAGTAAAACALLAGGGGTTGSICNTPCSAPTGMQFCSAFRCVRLYLYFVFARLCQPYNIQRGQYRPYTAKRLNGGVIFILPYTLINNKKPT